MPWQVGENSSVYTELRSNCRGSGICSLCGWCKIFPILGIGKQMYCVISDKIFKFLLQCVNAWPVHQIVSLHFL